MQAGGQTASLSDFRKLISLPSLFTLVLVEIGTIVLSRDSDLTDRPRGIDQIDRT